MENNSNNQGANPNRPRLKKVKRPVRKIVPQGPVGTDSTLSGKTVSSSGTGTPNNTNPFANRPSNQAERNTTTSDAFNLDAFLDGEVKPATSGKVPGKFNPRQPQFIDDEEILEHGESAEIPLEGSQLPPYLTLNILILIGAVLFFFGLVAGKVFLGTEKTVGNGLQGVVVNPEVPRGRARCGQAERTQGCVLYVMNPQRQDLNARDFYDLAAQMTGRQRFVIETGNMRYANTKIRPGEIAQLNIPPL